MEDLGHFSLGACDTVAVSVFPFPFSNLPFLTLRLRAPEEVVIATKAVNSF